MSEGSSIIIGNLWSCAVRAKGYSLAPKLIEETQNITGCLIVLATSSEVVFTPV